MSTYESGEGEDSQGYSGGYDLQFRNITFTVSTLKPGEKKPLPCSSNAGKMMEKVILQDLSGNLHAGELTCIIGASGAGKTSFLNVLAGRTKNAGTVAGMVYQNGKERTKADLARLGFVTQDDVMLEMLTAEELLNYAADLQLHQLSSVDRRARVDEILHTLRLHQCRDTLVGMPGGVKGLSGGERKRVNIALSMLRNPSILLLDEPTSGLDSATSLKLVKTLKTIAKSGRNVISTIHQPSAEMLATFDRIVLLAKGRVIYIGPVEECVDYFSELGYTCPENANAAEFLLDLTDALEDVKQDGEETYEDSFDSDDFDTHEEFKEFAALKKGEKEERGFARIEELTAEFAESKYHDDDEPALVEQSESQEGLLKRPNWFYATFVLLRREMKIISREPMLTKARFGQTMAMAIITGLLYFQVGDDQSSIRDRQGAMFFGSLNMIMSALMGTLFVFPKVRPVFLRETADNYYAVSSFYTAKVISDFPTQTFFPLLYTCVCYFMVGYDLDFSKFCIFAASMVMMAHTGAAMGLMLSAGVSTAEVANALAPLVFLPAMLFGGFFVKLDNIVIPIRYLQYLSPVNYISEILYRNEMSGQTFTCSDAEFVTVPNTGMRLCPITTGEKAIEFAGYDADVELWVPAVCNLALIVLCRVVGAFILWKSHRNMRYD